MDYVWFRPTHMPKRDLKDAVWHVNRLFEQLSPGKGRRISQMHAVIAEQRGARVLFAKTPTSAPLEGTDFDRETIICGMATLVPLTTLGRFSCHIEDVVVDAPFRGHGIGRALVQHLIDEARREKFDRIELTSQPAREAANALYPKLGFEKHETNVYRLNL